MIATSREPLSVSGEHVVPVPPLELPSAHAAETLGQLQQNEAVMLLLASPEVQGQRAPSELELLEAEDYGALLACWQLWQLAGLEKFLAGKSEELREALFRLVSSRLLEPQSKLANSEWQDSVHWPSPGPRPSYDGLKVRPRHMYGQTGRL